MTKVVEDVSDMRAELNDIRDHVNKYSDETINMSQKYEELDKENEHLR